MRPVDAEQMLHGSGLDRLGPMAWVDLGAGEGTFTIALAGVLSAHSRVHAVDRDCRALRAIPSHHNGVAIATHCADFTREPWPFSEVDGVLMANALHFVRDQVGFVRRCVGSMRSPGRFLIVEYDTDSATQWVPYPVSRARLAAVFAQEGTPAIRMLGSRPSVFRRASLYAALVTLET